MALRALGVHRFSRRMACAVITLIGVALAGPSPSAEPVEPSLSQLGVQQWLQKDGLSSNWVRDLVETPDGFIWIATVKGLSRFDGREFTHFNSSNLHGLPRTPVTALALDADGALLIGLEYGGIRRLKGQTLDPVRPNLLSDLDASVLNMRWQGDTLWIGTTAGLWRYHDGLVARAAQGTSLERAAITALHVAESALWVRSDFAGLWKFVDGQWQMSADAPDCVAYGFAMDQRGRQFTSCRNGVWTREGVDTSDWQLITPAASVGKLFLDSEQRLLIGGPQGLMRWSRGELDLRPLGPGLDDWRVRAFLTDRRGDLWVGTFSGGLTRLRSGPVRSIGVQEGLIKTGATGVLSDGTNLWVGSFRDGLLRTDLDGRPLQQWTEHDGLPGPTVWALAFDSTTPGAIWIGGEKGLAWLSDGHVHPTGPQGQAWSEAIQVLYADPQQPGTLWLSDRMHPLVELSAAGPVRHDSRRGLPLKTVRFIQRSRSGDLLVGGAEGLYRLQNTHWQRITLGDVERDYVSAMVESDQGDLWVAAGALGLVHLRDGQRKTYDYDSGLNFWPIHALWLDADSHLWMSGDEGIARVRLRDLDHWQTNGRTDLPIEHFDRRDGLLDGETNGWGYPALARLPDSRVILPSRRGMAVVDPDQVSSPSLLPANLYVRAAWAGTRELPLEEGRFRLAEDERSLLVHYSAVEMLRPDSIQFRHRLRGLDEQWVVSTTSNEARYSRIPPGKYQFELQARMPGQDWISASGMPEVVVASPWWLRRNLQWSAAALLLSFAGVLVTWRLRLGKRHADSLAKAREFLRDVVETSPYPIFVRTRSGDIALSNHAARQVIAASTKAREHHGGLMEASPSVPAQRLAALDKAVLSDGQEHVIEELELRLADDSSRWFKVIKRPAKSDDGQVVEHIITTAIDITDYKRAEWRLRESREEARHLAGQVLNAQEDERRRLAREIHDDITQRLAGLAMLAWSTLQGLQRSGESSASVQMNELAMALEHLANDVQALSRELHPAALEALGLVDALRTECRNFSLRTGFAIEFDCAGDVPELGRERSLSAYRIVQEALRNARNHSGSESAIVSIRGSRSGVDIEVRDFGRGFESANRFAGPGIGLASMRERARLAGAQLQIESLLGEGTCISVALPLAD